MPLYEGARYRFEPPVRTTGIQSTRRGRVVETPDLEFTHGHLIKRGDGRFGHEFLGRVGPNWYRFIVESRRAKARPHLIPITGRST